MSVDVGQIGDVTLYMDNTWQPAADDVWVYVYWDGAALGYISTDWKIGNSVSATLKGTNLLFLQMADLTNKYGNGRVAIADINLKALTAGSSPLTIRIDRVRGHTGVSVTNFTDLTPSATANQGTFVVRETPTPPPPVPQRLGAVVSYSSDSNVGRAVVDYVAASDQYGYHTVYRYPDNRGWYRHQSDSGRYQEARTVIEAQDLVIVGHVDTAKPLPIEARYVYPPLKYSIGDIVGEKATGPFRVVTRVDEGGANYYSPGSYTHKLVWMDGQGQWRTYDDSSGETWGDAQTDFESRYSVKVTHVELGTVIGGDSPTPTPVSKTASEMTTAPISTSTTPALPVSIPSVSSLSAAAQPTPIVIVVQRTADIDPGMTPYSGPTVPPTTPEPRSTAAAPRSTPVPAIAGSAMTASAATTTAAAPPSTYASAVATTAPPAENGSMVFLALGALLAVFGLVVGGIAYRSHVSARNAPVTITSGMWTPAPAPTPIAPTPAGAATAQAPWDGYSPLASDSYDLLARLRRYEDGVRRTGLGRTVPLADLLDLSLVPTLPIPAVARELGPGVGCQVISVDHLGGAVCLRDPGTAAERFDVVKVDEILWLIEERYEQRWVPREPGAD